MQTNQALAQKTAAMTAAFKAAGFDADYIKDQVAALVARESGAARDTFKGDLIAAVQKTADGIKANADLFAGATFAVEVTFNEKGAPTVTYISRTKGKGGSKGGKRPILIQNGLIFKSFEKLCRKNGVDPNGASGRVAYVNAMTSKGAPPFVEISADEWAANEEKLRKQHNVTGTYEAA